VDMASRFLEILQTPGLVRTRAQLTQMQNCTNKHKEPNTYVFDKYVDGHLGTHLAKKSLETSEMCKNIFLSSLRTRL
jgi:hypothetical protein